MIVDFFYNNIGKDLRAVNTAAISKDQGKSHAKDRTAESHCNKMLRIKFKGNFFKVRQAYSIDNKTHKCFRKEVFADQNDPGNKKRKKNKQYTKRQIIPGQLAYDNGDSGSSVINGIIGKQDTGNRKAGQYRPYDDHQIRKHCLDFFVHKGLLFVSEIVCQQ